MNDAAHPEASLQPHLQPGERLLWQFRPGATPLTRQERRQSLGFSLMAAVIGTTLASIGETPSMLLPLVFAGITAAITVWRRRSDRLSPTRLYAVTDRRALIVDGRRFRAFDADAIPYLDVQTLNDGSVDLVWGSDRGTATASNHQEQGATATAQIVSMQRQFKRGFLGLPGADPARMLIERLRQGQRDAVVAAVPTREAAVGGVAVTEPGWQTIRHPALGFAIDLPANWTARTARVRRYKLLGLIPFEPEPSWSAVPQADWNRLRVDTGSASVALQVSLNPEGFPVSLAAVPDSRLNRVLNLKTLESTPDLQIGALRGFSELQDLEGVGPSIGVGPVTVSAGEMKAQLLQRQCWLRAGTLAVHLLAVLPKGDPAVADALDRVMRTARVG